MATRRVSDGGEPAARRPRRALCEIAEERYHIDDVAGWLETPVHPEAPLSGLDLMASERLDLVLHLAATGMVTPSGPR